MPENFQSTVVSDPVTRRLRRDRNWFAVGAVVMIVIAMTVALPRRVQRYREQKALNAELLELQGQIRAMQGNIGEVERKITAAQQEIRKLQTLPR